jgi:hypothetical protein
MVLFATLFNAVLPVGLRATEAGRERLLTLNGILMTFSLTLILAAFTYTEQDSQREFRGFPNRLFTLPVPTWVLAGLPLSLGVLSVEVLYGAWLKLVFVHGELPRPAWLGILLGASVVFYMAILWGLAAFRISRIIGLGIVGILCMWVAFLPAFSSWLPSPWLTEKRLVPLIISAATAAAITAWIAVARQRTGAAGNRKWIRRLVDAFADVLPRRTQGFPSPAAAQFWFEWRRSGFLMPACVSAAISLIILPISWFLRHDAAGTLWILGWTVAMPTLLAIPIGKGFSKADFWSRDLSLPPFIAVRPFATGDLIVTKLKVAALSTITTWLAVILFFSIWLPLWADLSDLTMIRVGFWMVYRHSVAPQYAIAGLGVLSAMLLTWKFLVSGLWVGLAGRRGLFVGSGAAWCGAGLLAMIALGFVSNYFDTHRNEPDPDWTRILTVVEWGVACAVVLKLWLAAFSWRFVSSQRVRQYLLVWMLSLSGLVGLAVLLWADGTLAALMPGLPLDAVRMKHLLILLALVLVPLARIGFAPQSLARNRHGGAVRER